MTIEIKKVASANEAIEIINHLNYRHNTFCYTGSTFSNDYTVEYRHIDGYRDNGEKDGFAIIEIVVNGKLEIVRFFNLFRDITVDLKLGDFNEDYSHYDEVINADAETATENETAETKIAELKKELAEIRAEMKDESISDERWEHLRNYRHEISNEIENLEAEAATAEAGNNNDEVNTATCNGYIFTTYSTRTGFDSNGYTNDVESIEIKCDTLGNADTFDGLYRELTFFNEDNKSGWEVKTADGKILAKGTTEADAIKARGIICNGGSIETETATDNNEEIINATDDIIITEDAYTQMIRSELANAQIASGNYGIQINGEWVHFTNHKITRIDAGEFSFEYTLQGRKQFRHNGRVISREGVIRFFENKETAKAQEKSFREFFINPDAPKHRFFQVQISPTFADSCEHNYARYFEYFNQAIDFANDAIKFCGDVPTHITIKRDKQAGKVYYHRMPDGTVHVDKPDTDFFKNYSADEIKSRIGEIDRAIADNTQFRNENDSPIIGVAILNANDQLAVTKNFYEFVLHENAPITNVETDGSEEDDDVDEMPALFPTEDSDDDELIDEPEIDFAENVFIGQDGTNYIIRAKNINITVEDRKIKINGHVVAKYKTDAGVNAALKYVTDWRNNIANYKTFDINDWNTIFDDFDFTGGNEDKFVYIDDEPSPTDKVITPDEMLALVGTLETVNAAAPYGWQISYDGKNFPVEFNGKLITTLDSLALTKVLPPDKFFEQFNPDVPPKEHYINERRKELDMLLDFRKFVEDDSDRLKTLTNLIEDVKREILNAELDTEHPPDIEFDEHGDVIPWF